MRRLLPILTGVLVLAGACSGGLTGDGAAQDRGREAVAPATSQPPDSAPGGPAPGSGESGATVLDFTAPLVGGGTFEGQATAGDDLAVWFWSPW